MIYATKPLHTKDIDGSICAPIGSICRWSGVAKALGERADRFLDFALAAPFDAASGRTRRLVVKACLSGRSAGADDLRRLSLDERTCLPSPPWAVRLIANGLCHQTRTDVFDPRSLRPSEGRSKPVLVRPPNLLNFLTSQNLTKMAGSDITQLRLEQRNRVDDVACVVAQLGRRLGA